MSKRTHQVSLSFWLTECIKPHNVQLLSLPHHFPATNWITDYTQADNQSLIHIHTHSLVPRNYIHASNTR